jgi:hypothetical protein
LECAVAGTVVALGAYLRPPVIANDTPLTTYGFGTGKFPPPIAMKGRSSKLRVTSTAGVAGTAVQASITHAVTPGHNAQLFVSAPIHQAASKQTSSGSARSAKCAGSIRGTVQVSLLRQHTSAISELQARCMHRGQHSPTVQSCVTVHDPSVWQVAVEVPV